MAANLQNAGHLSKEPSPSTSKTSVKDDSTVIDVPGIVDTENADADLAEALAEQEEVDFPTALTSSSTPSVYGSQGIKQNADYEQEKRDFSKLDPRDYGIEFDEEVADYTPPEKDRDLPDLNNLLRTLEDGRTDLELRTDPPSLFTRPEHVTSYKKISELKLQLEEEEIDKYILNFDEQIKNDVLMIGNISLDEVQDEERRLRDEHIMYQEQEICIARDQRQEIILKEEEAKRRVALALLEKRKLLARKEEIAQQRERLQLDRLHRAFRRSENHLIHALEKRKAEISRFYGNLVTADGHYGGSKGRRWKVEWDKTPQPIQVKISCLRGVKDKLPCGRYVLMVSLYNRLGGHVMRWSSLKGQQWGGATLPIYHEGNFYNAEMKFGQSVFTVLPAKPNVRPGMVIAFELFLLRGAVVPTDRVVGWGAFPICDGQFDIVEGKYRVPFLRGEMDYMIDKHEKIEGLIASDLDHWLCNMYFEIVKLPRYLAGQKEYEVELQFSSGILAYPDRVKTMGEANRDGDDPIPGSLPQVGDNNQGSSTSLNITASTSDNNPSHSSDTDSIKKVPEIDNDDDKKKIPDENGSVTSLSEHKPHPRTTLQRPDTAAVVAAKNKEKKVSMEDDSDTDYEEEEVYILKKEDDYLPVKGKPGLYYKRHLNNPVDVYHKKMYSLLPKTPLLSKSQKKKKLTHLEQLEQHGFAVQPPFADKGHLPRRSMEKMNYVGRMFLAELGLSQWRSREFWGMLLMFCMIFFLRIYLHYLGQWLFLNILEIPINKLVFLPYTVNLNYQNTLLYSREEMAVVLLGPTTLILVFVLLIITSWLCQRILGSFPDLGSKFVVAFGIQAFLDPILILIVDCALLRFRNLGGDIPIGDFAKLYWHFHRAQGSGLAGIFITVFFYFATCFVAGSILYMYFLRLHNNGRMLDIYWRLHGLEDTFFVPYDLELSNQEMAYICKKAEQWRGEEGERKKVAVYDYIWEEEQVEESVWDENGVEHKEVKEGKKEITTHVSVHTIHLDGLRELYRHFLRLPDGAIVEVFGDMSIPGMDKDINSALSQGVQQVENLLGSQYSLTKIQERKNIDSLVEDGENEERKHPRPQSAGSTSAKKDN